jgi:hypothetical protein
MDSFIGFTEVTGAIIAAMGLAMGLEWLTLNGLMHLMPVKRDSRQPPSKLGESDVASRANRKSATRDFSARTLFRQ